MLYTFHSIKAVLEAQNHIHCKNDNKTHDQLSHTRHLISLNKIF